GDGLGGPQLADHQLQSNPPVLLSLDTAGPHQVAGLPLHLHGEKPGEHETEDRHHHEQLGERKTALVPHHRTQTGHRLATSMVTMALFVEPVETPPAPFIGGELTVPGACRRSARTMPPQPAPTPQSVIRTVRV